MYQSLETALVIMANTGQYILFIYAWTCILVSSWRLVCVRETLGINQGEKDLVNMLRIIQKSELPVWNVFFCRNMQQR